MSNVKAILADLVSFPTISYRTNLDLIGYVQEYLRHYGVESHLLQDPEQEKASLHGRIGPAVDGGIILSGHTDVVPVQGQPWSTDPFQLVEKDGRLYARGSADMKGFIACCLHGLPEMTGASLKYPIYFAFSYDEETGCQAGPELVKDIHRHYTERPRYAIIGEPTGMQPVVGQKGIGVFKTMVTGSQGHSSRIRQEVSAIHVAARLIVWIENKMDELIRAGRLDDRFDPNHSSLHVGIVEGGIAHNVIAGGCTFEWDVRTLPQDDLHRILADFQNYCRRLEEELRPRFSGFKIETVEYHPPVPPLDTPESASVVDLVRRLTGAETAGTVAFASEAGQYAEGGYETVLCGPGAIAQAHRADEFVTEEQLNRGVAFVRKIVEECS